MNNHITTPPSVKPAVPTHGALADLRIGFHILRESPLGNINRGANGLAKRMVWGETERQRVSSQCMKAALRDNKLLRDSPAAQRLGMSVRSARIADRKIAPILVASGVAPDDALAYADALIKAYFRSDDAKKPQAPKKAKKGSEGEEEDAVEVTDKVEKRNTIMVLGDAEIAALAQVALAARGAGLSPKDVASKKWGEDPALKAAGDAVKAMAKNHVGLDGALFGRFATGSTFSSVDAAVLVSPWMTIHPIQSHMDDFTAQDTLLGPDEAGAAHMNSTELSSGLFYSNVVVEVGTLMTNLGTDDPEFLAEAVTMIARVLLTTDPSAKRGSTGASGEVFEVIAEVLHGPVLTAAGFCRSTAYYDRDEAAQALLAHIQDRQEMLDETQCTEKLFSLRRIKRAAFLAAAAEVFSSALPLSQQEHNVLVAR